MSVTLTIAAEDRTYTIAADGVSVVSTSGNPLLTEDGLPILDETGEVLTTESAYRSRRVVVPVEDRTLEVQANG